MAPTAPTIKPPGPGTADRPPAHGAPGTPPASAGAAEASAPRAPALTRTVAKARSYLPGLLLVTAIGAVAVVLEALVKGATGWTVNVVEALVIALLLGVLLRNTIAVPAATAAGVAFAGKGLLEFAVLLMGASVDAGQVLRAGPKVLLLIGLCVALSLPLSRAIGRLLGLNPTLALLVAVGNGICGNSAIAAVAPVVRADKRDIALAVALTAVVGVGLVLGLPLLAALLALTQYQYGALVGTTVYAVPQVVAAAFPVGAEAGEVATFVKLVRVLAIAPVVVGVSLLVSRGTADRGRPGGLLRRFAVVPWFIAGFLVLMAANSTGLLGALAVAAGLPPSAPGTATKDVSRLLMIVAMAALGLGVELAAVKRVGPRVLAAVLASVLLLVCLSLSLIALLGL